MFGEGGGGGEERGASMCEKTCQICVFVHLRERERERERER